MEEKVFFDEAGIKVTKQRIVVPAQTYAMSGITSVTSLKQNPSRIGPIVLVVLGLLIAFVMDSLILGLLLLAGGVAWFVLHKPTWIVQLQSASGATEAYSSKDEDLVARIIEAINNAIIERN